MSHALQLRVGRVSTRIPVVALLACAVQLLLAVGITFLALMHGQRTFSPGEVWQALIGEGSRQATLYVVEWRLPRALAALLFGAMLGAAGAIFQTVTRNPLGSPDIIGFTSGAYTGGIATIILVGTSYHLIAGGALLGGVLTAVAVYLLSRRGGVQGFRLIIVGIGLTAMLTSFDTWLLLVADLDVAVIAATWGVGSLNGVSWDYMMPAIWLSLVALLSTILVARPLAQIDLGDDQASAIGARPERTRLLAILVGVALVALPTAVSGPIAFIALAAPQIGRRLAGAPGTPILPALCTGALLLSAADYAAQHLTFGLRPPVGLVTVSIGGIHLIWLILAENRKGSL